MAVKKNETTYPSIKIKLVKSLIGRTQKQRAVIKGLGLGKINSEVIREKRPEILGMVTKVNFLLEVSDMEVGK